MSTRNSKTMPDGPFSATPEADVSLAPGCFGMALAYRDDAPECQSCPFADKCKPLAAERLELVRSRLGLVLPARREPRKPVEAVSALSSGASQPSNLGAALRKGINPFQNNRKYLEVTCHLLITFPAGVTIRSLMRVFTTRLSMSPGVARGHIRAATKLLIKHNAVTLNDGTLKLKEI